ncbi:hypothetical protein, partial [Lacibacter luteus]|uniref:hypothetical protein n=1 Tax=Lacibacter luteus TaxID=2508719 RepID=UPI00197C65F1
YLGETRVDGNCAGNYKLIRSWKAEDACGNSVTKTQTITVTDNKPPVITCPKDVPCGSTTDPSITGKATATDNCGAVTITYSDVVVNNVTTRTWVARDECGNTSSCVQKIVTGPCSHIYHTGTTCTDYKNQLFGAELPQICYKTNGNKVGTVTPGVFFYYTSFTAPSASFCVDIVQSNSCGIANFTVQQSQVSLWDNNCLKVASGVQTNVVGNSRICITNATPGVVYTISVKYDAKSIEGIVINGQTCTYSFKSVINGITVEGSTGTVDLAPNCTATPPPSTTSPVITQNVSTQGLSSGSLETASTTVTTYPNPFYSDLTIRIKPSVSGKALLELYDLKGARLAVIFVGDVQQDIEKVVRYHVPPKMMQTLVYVLTIGKSKVTGKLISGNK